MKRQSTIRGAVLALACADVLAPIAACGSDDDGGAKKDAGSTGEKKPGAGGAAAGKDNGVAKLSAEQIYDKAMVALGEAGSAKVNQKAPGMTTEVRVSEEKCTGHSDQGKDGSYDITRVSKDVWIKPNEVLRASVAKETGVQVPADKFVHGDEKNMAVAPYAIVCSPAMFLSSAREKPEGTGAKGKPQKLNGQPVIPVVFTDGAEKTSLLVATTGKPYPLRIDTTDKDGAGTVAFSEFGKPVEASAPPASQVFEAPKVDPSMSPDELDEILKGLKESGAPKD
jgi:hypothetical protein